MDRAARSRTATRSRSRAPSSRTTASSPRQWSASIRTRTRTSSWYFRYPSCRRRQRKAVALRSAPDRVDHHMDQGLLWIGRLIGTAGVLLTALAALVRISGVYALGGFQVITLLFAGTAA